MKTVSLEIESDGALIRRFAKERDERAFTELVERHAALVAGVCARMLRQRQDAEDAFQAAFLVLARRANALQREGSLAGWLHAVAVRVCLKERTAGRRRDRRVQEAAQVARETNQIDHSRELRLVIDEELAQLPNDVRQVVVLCDLEGRARGEVAELLAIPLGTVSSRLARGREQLRKRLVRNGLAVATGGAALLLAECSQAAPSVSRELIGATVRNADAFTLGTAAAKATVNIRVLTLAEGVLRTMMLAQWKTVSSVFLVLGALTLFGIAVPGMLRKAAAEQVFLDDFEDGNAVDGSPVTWRPGVLWPDTSFGIDNGGLFVTSTRPDRAGVIGADGVVLDNTSIRGRVRIEGAANNEGAAVFARGNESIGLSYAAEISVEGEFLLVVGAQITSISTDLRPTREDVMLQVDVIGDQINGYAWRPSAPKPTTPLLSAVDNQLASGLPGVYYSPDPEIEGAAVFRYVQVADRPIVPEPSGGALCAIGGTLLSLGLLFQRRRYRP